MRSAENGRSVNQRVCPDYALTFFAQGFEHSVVNMFVIPAGMILGAHVTISDWWLWNQLPVTLGNVLGGLFFTGLALHLTHGSHVTSRTSSTGLIGAVAEN